MEEMADRNVGDRESRHAVGIDVRTTQLQNLKQNVADAAAGSDGSRLLACWTRPRRMSGKMAACHAVVHWPVG